MSFQNDKDRDRKRKSDPESGAGAPPPKPKKKRVENPELGNALRTVYQRTIDEAIPPEMLDLLGKLG